MDNLKAVAIAAQEFVDDLVKRAKKNNRSQQEHGIILPYGSVQLHTLCKALNRLKEND